MYISCHLEVIRPCTGQPDDEEPADNQVSRYIKGQKVNCQACHNIGLVTINV